MLPEKSIMTEEEQPLGIHSVGSEELVLPPGIKVSEFLAVEHLLDDPDEDVVTAVREKMISYGYRVVPYLRGHILQYPNLRAKETVMAVVQHHQKTALTALINLVQEAKDAKSDIDLEQAFVLLSRFGYPETDTEVIATALDEIALRTHAIFMKSSQHNDLGLLLSMNQAFFEETGFAGAEDDCYHNPDNTFAHTLWKTKRGIPISLSALYLLIAERTGMNLYGVGMPAHFLVFHPELDIFIDAFNNGAFLSRDDCKRFIKSAGFSFEPSMLEKVSNIAILMRMIRNLIFAYSKTDNAWEIDELHELSATILETMNQEEE